jgi:hypothetical protein
VSLNHAPSLADSITTTPEFRFSVHTGCNFNQVEVTGRDLAKNGEAALMDTSQGEFVRVLPLLSISNAEAAVIKVAEQIVDVEAAMVSVAAGKKKPWRKYREQFASALQIHLSGTDEMWNYLARLCQNLFPNAAFRLGVVYIDYSFESVKFRF